jgi:DNA-directed RNA polymerase specialized sigma24 family protein
MTTLTAIDIWEASQTGMVQTFARKLWGTRDGAEDGIQTAIVYALTRKDWFDSAKGKLATWLMLILKSVRQAERSKGHRRGTVSEPRVFCPGDDALPVVPDLCDPEGILIARELDLDAVGAQRAKDSRTTHSKLTPEAVRFIRASGLPHTVLAKRFKVHPSNIYLVRAGKTYKEVA